MNQENMDKETIDQETMEKCLVRTIVNLLYEDDGIVVEVDNKKFIVMRSEDNSDEIVISEITKDDDDFFQELNEGEMIYLERD